jgi:uncharacterized membrane protein
MTNQPPSTASRPGLSDNAAGALAYVTIIPAILFLLVEPYNKSPYIRFHAWQCIYLAIACAAADCAAFILNALVLHSSVIVDGLYSVIHLVGLMLLVLLLMKALNGERFKLPFIGRFAAWRADS